MDDPSPVLEPPTQPTPSPFATQPLERTVSADELFAEDAPKDDVPPTQEPEPTAATPTTEVGSDEDVLDEVPLSPQMQRPAAAAEATFTAPAANGSNGVAPVAAAAPTTPAGPDSLFAAIGMPPPPFSKR